MSELPAVLVFLKYPSPGQVKTRLARSIGDLAAAQLYRDWISQTLLQLQAVRNELRLIAYFDGAEYEAFAEWHPLIDVWWPQSTGDLGERLSAGFQRAFDIDVPTCLAIGTDCLELENEDLRQAFRALISCDCVFGPTHDGGYYLVGLRQNLGGFFADIRWSTEYTLSDHLKRCRDNGWTHELLTPRSDIDTLDQWLSYTGQR